MTARRRATAALVAAAAIALTGCGGGATAAPTPKPTASATPSPSPTPSTTPSVAPTPTVAPSLYPTADTISCETMLDPAKDAAMRESGLFPAPKPFTMLNFVPTLPAIECPWGIEGDFHSHAYYTWAQLAPGESAVLLRLGEQNNAMAEVQSDGSTWLSWPDQQIESVGIMVTDEWAVGAATPEAVNDVVWTR